MYGNYDTEITVNAFGQTRKVKAWHIPNIDDKMITEPVFWARLGRGSKVWKVDGTIFDYTKSLKPDGSVDLKSNYCVILNRPARIYGWWTDRAEKVKSHHNSAHQ